LASNFPKITKVIGRYDAIVQNNDTIKIVDFKTTQIPTTKNKG
jgi:RecB family exonuclease